MIKNTSGKYPIQSPVGVVNSNIFLVFWTTLRTGDELIWKEDPDWGEVTRQYRVLRHQVLEVSLVVGVSGLQVLENDFLFSDQLW